MNRTRKQKIYEAALLAKERNEKRAAALCDRVSLNAYLHLVTESEGRAVWTAALQAALREHEVVVIPPSQEVYWLDGTVTVPSNRRIEAVGATIRALPEYRYLMLRNEHTQDGTRAPIDTSVRDENVTILGGRWEENSTRHEVRRYSADPSVFCGVQTCMLFNNITGLTVRDVTFGSVGSFCMQVGDLRDGVFENLSFVSCYSDGLHINGNSQNLYIRNFSGDVGDDLVALNMYDWLGSSVNYGPASNIFCEDIHSSPDGRSRAMRFLPGIFIYDDGTAVDCAIRDVYIRSVSGIYEYKLYYQTPPYQLGERPEGGGAGTVDNLFLENINIIASRPRYLPDVPVRGHFGMFALSSKIGALSLENIRYTCRGDEGERTHLILVGPFSRCDGTREIFDPYIDGRVEALSLENISINGERVSDIGKLLKVIAFRDLNGDGHSSGSGSIGTVMLDGQRVTPPPTEIIALP